MVKYVVEVPDSITLLELGTLLHEYFEVDVSVYRHHDDTGTRNSRKPDRRQSTRLLHDSAQKRLKK